MVSFYDYAFLKVKHSHLLLVLLLTFGCHNNAHIRTQKHLQLDEKTMSVSAVLPTGGNPENHINYERGEFKGVDVGIIGPRVIISSITGKTQSETGFFGGLGLIRADGNNRNSFGLVLGTQRKKYLNLFGASPQKVGAIFELNVLNKGGPTIQVFPSITTTTNEKQPHYFGAHGIIISGIRKVGLVKYEAYELEDDGYSVASIARIEKPFKYNSNSFGVGLTIGTEKVFNKKSSFQLQMDFSIVNNSFTNKFQPKENFNSIDYRRVYEYENGGYTLVQNEKNPFINENKDPYSFIVSGSMGYNFFKPPPPNNHPISPLPPLQKNIFNPETGERLKKTDVVFDPETGEIIAPLNESSYFEEDKFTERQLIDLAKKNAQEKHIGALWSLFGLTGVPSSAFGSIFGLLILGEVSDGTLAFPGFILGGSFGVALPSALAKVSSKLTKVAYPPEIETTEQEMKYKKTYKSEVGVLRQKSTAIGTIGGFVAFAAFIMLVVVGN